MYTFTERQFDGNNNRKIVYNLKDRKLIKCVQRQTISFQLGRIILIVRWIDSQKTSQEDKNIDSFISYIYMDRLKIR